MGDRLQELLDRMVGVPRDNTTASEKHEVWDCVRELRKDLSARDATIRELREVLSLCRTYVGTRMTAFMFGAERQEQVLAAIDAALSPPPEPASGKARLDPDGTAKGKTILTAPIVGYTGPGIGTVFPGPASFHIDTETGKRTGLAPQPDEATPAVGSPGPCPTIPCAEGNGCPVHELPPAEVAEIIASAPGQIGPQDGEV